MLTAVIVFSLTFVFMGIAYQYDNKYTAGPPYGQDGVFAFSETDLDHPIYLIDGWKVRIGGTETTAFIGEYSNYAYLPGGTSPFSTATYAVTLRYTGTPQVLTMEIPEIYTDYTLKINGSVASVTGDGTSVNIPVGNADIHLEFTITNEAHYYSGLIYPPAIGTSQAMTHLFFVRTLIYSVLCISALTLALYSLALWIVRSKKRLFRHFGFLCLAFAIQCSHQFIWQLGLSSTFWYAIEDTARLLLLAQCVSIGILTADLEHLKPYRYFVQPLTLLACVFCFVSVMFIIPGCPSLVNLYGYFIDGYKLTMWVLLAIVAGIGLSAKKSWSTVFILSACGIFGASLFATIGDSNKFEPIYGAWQNEYAGFFMVLIFGGLMVLRNIELIRQEKAFHILELQNRFAVESARQMEDAMGQVRMLKHDLNHHISALNAYFLAGDYERLGAYLNALNEQKTNLKPLYYAEHFLINTILSYYLEMAKNHGIIVSHEVHIPKELSASDADLCTLLSNILSNAVEGCLATPESANRFIKINLLYKKGNLHINCINSSVLAERNDQKFPTTKKDSAGHGLGIPAIRKIAEKYYGAADICNGDGRFTVNVFLHLDDETRNHTI